MNFNRQDSLKFTEVLNDPQFVAFLRKWENERRPSAVRAIFISNFFPFLDYNLFLKFLILTNFFSSFHNFIFMSYVVIRQQNPFVDSESPALSLSGVATGAIAKSPEIEEATDDLPNQISAAYEVPQFPIEQIEKKLMLQRHLTAK